MNRSAFVLGAAIALPLLSCGTFPDETMVPPKDYCEPIWLWVGHHDEAPACPDGVPPAWDGWAEVKDLKGCGDCSCGPAACVLPKRVTTHGAVCPGGDNPIDFTTPDAWDGTCTASGLIIPAQSFASVRYEGPTLAPCTPSSPPKPLPITDTFARACTGTMDKPPQQFTLCMPPNEDGSCPLEVPHLREFYTKLDDYRSCTPCECGAPLSGACSADVYLYTDTACRNGLSYTLGINLNERPCSDMTVDLPLVAMESKWSARTPGTCEPTVSKVTGSVEPSAPQKLCCKQ
jgi:hypothetical protein